MRFHRQRVAFYRLILKVSRYHFWPLGWLVCSFDRLGVEFVWHGDTVIRSWPWRMKGTAKWTPYISLGFSGTGEFGDARYATLKELDADWKRYFEAA